MFFLIKERVTIFNMTGSKKDFSRMDFYRPHIETIRELIKERGMSQAELSRFLRMNKLYLNQILCCKYPLPFHLLCRICECLQVDLTLNVREEKNEGLVE